MQVGFGEPPGDGGAWGAGRMGDAMIPVGEWRELVIRVREGLRLALGAMLSWRESLATLAIGTLSTALGVAALAVRHPRFDLVYAAFVGHWLGIGGVFSALRIGRGISLLSVLGTALCLAVVGPIYALAALGLLGIAAWMVLSVWAVRGVLRVLGG